MASFSRRNTNICQLEEINNEEKTFNCKLSLTELPLKLPPGVRMTQLVAGGLFFFALTSDKKLYRYGSGSSVQLALNMHVEKAKRDANSIAGGSSTTCNNAILTINATVWN